LWATHLRCPQIHRLLGRRAESSDLRGDIVGASFRVETGEVPDLRYFKQWTK
jgi:hypothetical protein